MRIRSAFAGLLVALAALLPAYGAEECTATFRVNLTSQVNSVLHLQVMVSTDATRAQVGYNLLLTVTSASGEQRVVTKPRNVKIGVGTVIDIVTHTLGSGESLVGFDAELVSCTSQS